MATISRPTHFYSFQPFFDSSINPTPFDIPPDNNSPNCTPCSQFSYRYTNYCLFKAILNPNIDTNLESKGYILSHFFIIDKLKYETDVIKAIRYFSEKLSENFILRFSFIKQTEPEIKLAKPTVEFCAIHNKNSKWIRAINFILDQPFIPTATQLNTRAVSNLGRSYELNYFNSKNLPFFTQAIKQARIDFIKDKLGLTVKKGERISQVLFKHFGKDPDLTAYHRFCAKMFYAIKESLPKYTSIIEEEFYMMNSVTHRELTEFLSKKFDFLKTGSGSYFLETKLIVNQSKPFDGSYRPGDGILQSAKL